jgi:hypothetical protein
MIDFDVPLASICDAAGPLLMGGLPRRLLMSSVPRLSARQLQQFEARYVLVKRFANTISLLVYISARAPDDIALRWCLLSSCVD